MTTDIGSGRLHADAFLALLAADGFHALAVNLFDNEVPANPPTPYTVLWSPPGTASRSGLIVRSDRLETTAMLQHVGGDRNEALGEADRVRRTLLDRVPVIAGRVCWPITQEGDGGTVAQDPDSRTPGQRRAFLAVAYYRLASLPA